MHMISLAKGKSKNCGPFLAVVVLVLIACCLIIFLIFWAISYFESTATPQVMTTTAMYVDKERIFDYIREHQSLPKNLSELPQSDGKLDGTKDGWRRPILYSVAKDDSVTLVSLGSDGKLGGTGDAADIIQSFATKDAKGNWIQNPNFTSQP